MDNIPKDKKVKNESEIRENPKIQQEATERFEKIKQFLHSYGIL